MLICNLIILRHKIVKLSWFGIEACSEDYTRLIQMMVDELGFFYNCSSAHTCFVPTVCSSSSPVSCSLQVGEEIDNVICNLIVSQIS